MRIRLNNGNTKKLKTKLLDNIQHKQDEKRIEKVGEESKHKHETHNNKMLNLPLFIACYRLSTNSIVSCLYRVNVKTSRLELSGWIDASNKIRFVVRREREKVSVQVRLWWLLRFHSSSNENLLLHVFILANLSKTLFEDYSLSV